MAKGELRRSERLGSYDSNGRDYLASRLGWSQSLFEEWLYTPSVRPHLQDWHVDCIVRSKHFNESVDWINTGPHGYFYNTGDLEEDVSLLCLCAGNDGEPEDGYDFAEQDTNTKNWLTQDLWARTAWRLVQSNCAEGQVFHSLMHNRPAVAYGFAVELLCIAFHSVAFRGADSVYLKLLEGGNPKAAVNGDELTVPRDSVTLDTKYEDDSDSYTSTASSSDADRASDATFAERKRKRMRAESKASIAESERSTIIIDKDAKGEHDKQGCIDDIESEIKVAPRKIVAASTALSPQTADGSSVEDTGKKEPLTPETNFSFHGRMEGEEMPKDEQVNKWLVGLGSGPMAMWS